MGYLKILLSFCVYKNRIDEVEIIEFFRNKDCEEIEKYASFCNLDFLHKGRLCHRIYLVGDSSIQKMYGIISLYDVIPMVFILNANYQGKNFLEQYTYDVLNQKEILDRAYFSDFDLKRLFIDASDKELYIQMYEAIHSNYYFMNFFTNKIQADELLDLCISFVNSDFNQYRLFDEEIKKDLFDFFISRRETDERLLLIRDETLFELSYFLIETLRENFKWEMKKY